MSYEGYTEFLTFSGEYLTYDSYNDHPEYRNDIEWYHLVDETNGIEYDNPSTFPAEKIEIDHVDIWREDHYGNRYAIKSKRYIPAINSTWEKYNER